MIQKWRGKRGSIRTTGNESQIAYELIDFFAVSPLKIESLLRRKYLDEGKSPTQIAKELGVSVSGVRNSLSEFFLTKDEDSKRHYIPGEIPYGWKKSKGMLIPHKGEQSVIAEIKLLREQGHSLRTIVKVLNEKGIKAKYGGKWHPESVRRALQKQNNEPPDLT